MSKRQTDTDRSVAKLNEEIRVLQLVRDRLIAEQDTKRKHTRKGASTRQAPAPGDADSSK
jgi:hypothetical protein